MQTYQGQGAAPAITPTTQRQEFGATEQTATGATHESAMEAQMRAQVEARYITAMRRPRDWEAVRQRIVNDCMRPTFAETARYSKPVGGTNTVEGWSIRFVEAALRNMHNTQVEQMVVHDDSTKRVARVMVTDLESNVTYSQDIIIMKQVEKSFLKPGEKAISSRTNSRGKPVHLVEATESEIVNKIGAEVSKAIRNNGLRMLPGDMADDALEQVERTQREGVQSNPTEARRKVIDAFAGQGIELPQLCEYLGIKAGNEIAPSEVIDLRKLYTGLKNGDVRWSEAVEAKRLSRQQEQGTQPAAEEAPKGLKAKAAARKATRVTKEYAQAEGEEQQATAEEAPKQPISDAELAQAFAKAQAASQDAGGDDE